jgi:signal transduction histidine kinase
VTQLLSFARKESAAEQPLSVDELLHSVVDLFRANAREQGVDLECVIESDARLAGKCVSALRDAVSNLLLNALQSTPSGGQVKLTASAANGDLLITVVDTGAGVPVELRERIWEPFFTTKQRGTGLGLAIVRKRVQEVGGSASLGGPRNGRGAVFHLRVPVEPV